MHSGHHYKIIMPLISVIWSLLFDERVCYNFAVSQKDSTDKVMFQENWGGAVKKSSTQRTTNRTLKWRQSDVNISMEK